MSPGVDRCSLAWKRILKGVFLSRSNMVVASKYDRMLLHADFNEYFGLYLIDGSKPGVKDVVIFFFAKGWNGSKNN
jgi:hypothetical protein